MIEQINEDEVVEDLGIDNFRIIQKVNGFRFGLDALALSDFANIKKGDTVCELGCGTAVVSHILSKRSNCKMITAIDIDESYCDMAQRSVDINGLGDIINIINCDVKKCASIFDHSSFNAVVCNPPYFKTDDSADNSAARHESLATISDWVKATAFLLKNRGRAYFVFTTSRIAELFSEFNKFNLTIKKNKIYSAFYQ